MTTGPRLDEIARLLADRSRAAMIGALMDGRHWTGRELADAAGVTPSTASLHLQRLVNGALVDCVPHGRHKYYRIGRAGVAQAIETLMTLAPLPPVPRHAGARAIDASMRRLRTCYDHLAGRIAVELCDALVARGAVVLTDTTADVTPAGAVLFAELGLALEGGSRRPLCRPCLDWSERRHHLAGRIGTALAQHALQLGWVVRRAESRALEVTPLGARAFDETFARGSVSSR